MIIDKKIKDFINELKSSTPTPGGGGVASLNSAQGVALIMMVANFTVNNDKYCEWHTLCNSVLSECQELLDILMKGIDDDAEEFTKVIAAYGLPKESDEDKEKRSRAISEASISAAEAPLRVMKASARALELDLSILGKSNPNIESDLYVAARSLQAGLLSAKYNVDANIGGIKKINPDLAEEYKIKADELIDKCNELMGKMFIGGNCVQ